MDTNIDAKLIVMVMELSRDQCVDILEASFGSGLYDNQTAGDLRQLVASGYERGSIAGEEIVHAWTPS